MRGLGAYLEADEVRDDGATRGFAPGRTAGPFRCALRRAWPFRCFSSIFLVRLFDMLQLLVDVVIRGSGVHRRQSSGPDTANCGGPLATRAP